MFELSETVNREMYIAYFDDRYIEPVFVTRESKSGDTVQTEGGRVMKTVTKNRAIFHKRNAAILAIKLNHDEIDEEAHYIAKELGLRIGAAAHNGERSRAATGANR